MNDLERRVALSFWRSLNDISQIDAAFEEDTGEIVLTAYTHNSARVFTATVPIPATDWREHEL